MSTRVNKLLWIIFFTFSFLSVFAQKSNRNNLVVFRNDSLFKVLKGKLVFQRLIYSNGFETDNFVPLEVNSELYLINGIGGAVLKEIEGRLKRIDHSFEHRNQIASSLFVQNDTIFRFGGYGFFDTRNFFTYYSNGSNEWEVYQTNSKEFPLGRMSNKHFITGEYFYILGGSTIDVNNRKKTIPINDIWRFSFKSKKWELVKILETFKELSWSRTDIFSGNKFYFKVEDYLFSFDINDISLSRHMQYQALEKVDPYFFVTASADSLFFRLKVPHSTIQVNPNFSIAKKELHKSQVAIEEEEFPLSTIIVAIVALFLLSIVLYHKLNQKEKGNNRFIHIQDNILQYKDFKISLSEIELLFMKLFLDNDRVENAKLIELIESDIDISQKTRIKNNVLHDINNKLQIISDGEIEILKQSSSRDKRYYEYTLHFKA